MLDGENCAVDFLGRLQLIAAVDEQHRAFGEHDGETGRAGKAGDEGKPLGAGWYVFILIAIGARHDETVEPAPRQLGAQRRHPRRAGATLGAVVERLEARFEHGSQCSNTIIGKGWLPAARTPAWSSRRNPCAAAV